MHDQITPVLLTFNEEPNLGRTLARLTWAKRIVIVDSFSTDATVDIARGFPQVEVFQRPFDSFCAQYTYAVRETGIDTPWVLALDADFVLSEALIRELAELTPDESISAYRAHFRYCIDGKELRGALLPPITVLFRPERTSYRQDGHAHRLTVHRGDVGDLRHPIQHDDRKSILRWIQSQAKYATQEAEKIHGTPWRELPWIDRLRRLPLVTTPIAFGYSLVAKRGVLDGRAGLMYATQRAAAELLISLSFMERAARHREQDTL